MRALHSRPRAQVLLRVFTNIRSVARLRPPGPFVPIAYGIQSAGGSIECLEAER